MKKLEKDHDPEMNLGFILNFLMKKIHDGRMGPNTFYRVLFFTSYFPITVETIPGYTYKPEDMTKAVYYPTFAENFKKLVQVMDLFKISELELMEVIFSRKSLFDVLELKGYPLITHLTSKDYFPLSEEERLLMAA